MDQIMSYLTMEKLMVFLVASMAISILFFFIKQFFKFLLIALVIGAVIFYYSSSPTLKDDVSTCVKNSIAIKGVSQYCKDIFSDAPNKN